MTAAESEERAVLTERRGPVLLITMNRAEARNAIDEAVSRGLEETLALLDGDPELRVGVLTGALPGFSAGMDLKGYLRGDHLSGVERVVRHGARTPLVAAIEGFALAGGLGLALVCDVLVASRAARLGIPEASRGLMAGGGGVLRLPGRVGVGRALHLGLIAQPIDGERAERWGWSPSWPNPVGRSTSRWAGRPDRRQRPACGGYGEGGRPRNRGDDRAGGMGVPGPTQRRGLPIT